MVENTSHWHKMYCSGELHDAVEDAAEAEGKSVSEWLRDASTEKLEAEE